MLFDMMNIYEWFFCYNWDELCSRDILFYFSSIYYFSGQMRFFLNIRPWTSSYLIWYNADKQRTVPYIHIFHLVNFHFDVNKKSPQTPKNTFGLGTHFLDDYSIRILIFEQFVLLWFRFSRWRLMLGPADSNSGQPTASIFSYDSRDLCCQGVCKICTNDPKMNHDKTKFSSRWKCEWKSSDEMGPRALRQPNLRKEDLPWKGRSVSPLINIHSSIKALHQSIIDVMDIHNSNMGVYNSLINIHNSVTYIHNSISDIQWYIIEK